jgi:hypothetical protein
VAEPEQVAILVVLNPGTSEVEAAALRIAMRLWPQVADVRPVSQDNRQAIAESRARGQVADEMAPIFENLRREVTGALDIATDSFAALSGEEPPDPVRIAEQQAPV